MASPSSLRLLPGLLLLLRPLLVSSWPTQRPPPPPPVLDRLPPPPSPPPSAVLSAFNSSATWYAWHFAAATDVAVSPPAPLHGLLVVQLRDDIAIVFGAMSLLGPDRTVELRLGLSSSGCEQHLTTPLSAHVNLSATRGMIDVREVPFHVPPSLAADGRGQLILQLVGEDVPLACQALSSPGTTHAQLALIKPMPAYAGHLRPHGLLLFRRHRDRQGREVLRVRGVVFGLEADVTGMWHIHQGFNCDGGGAPRTADVDPSWPTFYPGVGWGYFTARSRVRGPDPWTSTIYRTHTAGSGGAAHIDERFVLDSSDSWTPLSQAMASESDEQEEPCAAALPPLFLGRHVIFHTEDGTAAACASIGGELPRISSAYVITERHPSYDGSMDVALTASLTEHEGSLRMHAVVTGVKPNANGTWRIHEGFSCRARVDLPGHVYPFDVGLPFTPFGSAVAISSAWQSDAHGNAFVSWEVSSPHANLKELQGRTLIVSLANGTPAACGQIEPAPWLTGVLVAVDGEGEPRGVIMAAQAAGGSLVRGVVIGLPASSEGRWWLEPIEGTSVSDRYPFAVSDAGVARFVSLIERVPIDDSDGASSDDDHGVAGLRGRAIRLGSTSGGSGGGGGGGGGASYSMRAVLLGGVSEALPSTGTCKAEAGLSDRVRVAYMILGVVAILVLLVFLGVLHIDNLLRRSRVLIRRSSESTIGLVRVARSISSHTRHSPAERSAGAKWKSPGRRSPRNVGAAKSPFAPTGNRAAYILDKSASRKGNASALLAPQKLPRLLALHGAGANEEVVRLQLSNIGVTEGTFEIICLRAPIAADAGGGTTTVENLIEGPYYSWYNADSTRDDVIRMLRRVIAFIQDKGPFDAIFGFSQGAAVVAACMQGDVLARLEDTMSTLGTAPPNQERSAAMPPPSSLRRSSSLRRATSGLSRMGSSSKLGALKQMGSMRRGMSLRISAWGEGKLGAGIQRPTLAVLAHAVSPCALRELLGLTPLPLHRVAQSSLHIIGVSDPFKAESEHAAQGFARGSQHLVLYHPAAHEMPRELQLNAALHHRMMAHVDRALGGGAEEALPGLGEPETVSTLTRIAVALERQVVCTTTDPALASSPSTLRGLLKAQPATMPCLSGSGGSSDGGEWITYGELASFISPGGGGDLARIGIRERDVVAYAAPGGCTAAVAFVTIASQCVAAPFDPAMTESDATSALNQLNVKHVILFEGAHADGLSAAAASRRESIMVHHATGGLPQGGGRTRAGLFTIQTTTSSMAAEESGAATSEIRVTCGEDSRALPTAAARDVASRATALLLRTSGTTAQPKVVPLTQRALVKNGTLLAASLGLAASDVCLNVMPLFHIGGLSASLLASWAAGGRVICLDAFQPAAFCAALAAAPRPTWYSAVPTIHTAVVEYLRERGAPPDHSLRFVRSGAAALLPADAQALSAAFGGVRVLATYSMSEQMPISQPPTGFDPAAEGKLDSVGVPTAVSVAVVDSQSLAPLPYGATGQIAIGGETVMSGYLGNEAANRDSFFLLSCEGGVAPPHGDRFFLTGDTGALARDGHLRITGRAKELIKRGGEQISPHEVEAALHGQAWLRAAYCFPAPSRIWGEEVGVALVLPPTAHDAAREPSGALLKRVRATCADANLAPGKWPSFAIALREDDIPRTATRKVVRGRLAQVPAVAAELAARNEEHSVRRERLGAPKVSRALDGVRFFLASQVVFNHVGLQAADTHGTWGAVAQARFFCIHVPTFFALGGFSLAINMGPPPRSKLTFVATRLSSMYPMYLVSLALLLVNLLASCTPSTFDPSFHALAQPSDRQRGDFCEPAPLLEGYWASLFATVAIYALGLQSWPLYLASWFLSYYSWFSSVYYGLLATFPSFYERLILLRGRKRVLWALAALLIALNYCVVAGWAIGWHDRLVWSTAGADRAAELTAQASLMYYLFPPFWWPSFAVGSVAAFIYDASRPYLSHRAYLWGWLCDAISVGLLAQAACYVALASCEQKYGHRCPSDRKVAAEDGGLEAWLGVDETDAISTRTLAGIVSRLYLPIMVVWLYAMAVGRGWTCWLFSRPLFVRTLAPASYNVYLFHQWVGQVYYLATRHEWWSYHRFRKTFFWFSPQPVPVAWYEYFAVLGLTTLFAIQMAHLDPWLIAAWDRAWRSAIAGCRRCLGAAPPHHTAGRQSRGGEGEAGESEDRDTMSIVLDEIETITGVAVEPDWSLAECGLASVAAPIVRTRLERALPGVSLALEDLVRADTVLSLAELLDERRSKLMATGVT